MFLALLTVSRRAASLTITRLAGSVEVKLAAQTETVTQEGGQEGGHRQPELKGPLNWKS